MPTGLPSPPFFEIPHLDNLRDAAQACGGLKTREGKSVRKGVLWRSAEVSSVGAEGWRWMRGLGVAHVFDLRSKPEVDKGWAGITGEGNTGAEEVRKGWEEGLKSAGVERSWVPVFAADDYSPERLAERYMKYLDKAVEGFISAYHDILVHGGPAFRTILLYLASLPPATSHDSSQKPIGALIHCTAGKDRTGIFFGLLLSFLGVPDEQIADEYQLTELGLKHIHEQVVPRLMASPAFEKYQKERMVASEEEGRQAALRMLGAKRESMLGALGMLRREWGSAEGYVMGVCGLGDGEVEKLRRVLVVEA
ncbi:hypothetical protein BU23DRAFT_541932 [Bimuria novae-zelandiae CBS 107.79]|uniref:Tyrosine specific protein phosphatases domain-containing protein n=1 Tax=Bimuria novae-zelandiae CBS 107.79 TaxID=1447943 RepID=A0A6A5UU79_9PLEO|nr:hypothetical protein BU23DRAFT_541932 [Bimuria novae-zelandiae CBS 107.79]